MLCPDRLSHMSAGNGTLSHLMMEDFKQRAGIRILHVPYKGSPPTIAESGFPGFEAVAWIALSAPRGTPAPLRERINAEVGKMLADPEFANRIRGIGAQPRPSTVDGLGRLFASEQARWKAVVERTGVKAD